MFRLAALVIGISFACSALAQATGKNLFVTNNTTGTVTSFSVSPGGILSSNGIFPAGANPQDCGLTIDGRNLIVVNATIATMEELFTFVVNPDATLTRSEPPSIVGDGPLSLNITSSNFALVPSAGDDNLSSFRIINDNTSLVNTQFAGTFPIKVMSTHDAKFVFCTASASPNQIYRYALSPTGVLTNLGAPATFSGGSLQGLAVAPDDSKLYVSTALSNVIAWYEIGNDGSLTFEGSANSGGNSCVEIAMHPAATWLYVCNVVSDTLTVMPVGPDGSLSNAVYSYSIGSDIRDVVTDGEYVYVTDESSISGSPVGVVVFHIESDGQLTRQDTYATGGGRPQFMALWDPEHRTIPFQLALLRGLVVAGTPQDLVASDDSRLVLRPGIVFSTSEAPIQLRLRARAPTASPRLLEFVLESRANQGNIGQRIFLFNFKANTYEDVHMSTLATSDMTVTLSYSGNPSRFIDPATQRIEALVTYRAVGPVFSYPWLVGIDQAYWRFDL